MLQKFKQGIIQGLGISLSTSVFLIIGILLIKADRSGVDGLTASGGEILTSEKWNSLVNKTDSFVGWDNNSYSFNTTYQATSNILVSSNIVCSQSNVVYLYGYSDSNSNPDTLIGRVTGVSVASLDRPSPGYLMFPVKKGDYRKITTSNSLGSVSNCTRHIKVFELN